MSPKSIINVAPKELFEDTEIDEAVADGLPTFQDVLSAVINLRGVTHETPVISSKTINEMLGAKMNNGKGGKIEVFFKCENLQKCGSFKSRGAYNAISRLSDEQKKKGCIAYSAGNHGQGVALSGGLLGIKTTIIMPSDAPQMKKDAIQEYGAEVIFFDRATDDLDEVIKEQVE